ncbi:zinc finger protein 654-like [Conger conger]|uniref:zinc finger protein 654-like n=1 Tax=Conger conger TaxID=82655 RepID=UPI002A59B223|nr:zinc finger protein 654-like [Conger conger]
MAEEESDFNSERFKEELDHLLDCGFGSDCDLQSKNYCSRFCELVEEYSTRWQVPLPQLQVLRTALCCFTQSTVSLPSNCEHVQYVLSSLALSFFELLLFFGKDEFLEDPLKDILESFQDCHSNLGRHSNAYLLQVKLVMKDGGPWESPMLQAILKEFDQPQEEVERYLSSEMPVFLELRIRYLLACERTGEAMALAKACIEHPALGKHLYFHQAYLICLWKASLYDRLHKEMAEIDGRLAVEIICNTESEERDDLLLALCKAFLIQQLQTGDMYYLWELVFIWSKLHLRENPSKQGFLEQCQQLMLSAKNVKSIFPFLKVIKAELGKEGLQFCVEQCACALQMDLRHDHVTKALLYKTIAYLLPNDLEVCRACALLVFFLERSVESYKTVYLLYTHPDQEYQVDYGPVKNHVRFEMLRILKRGLFFDPEFCNLIALRTNCLKLMSEKVMEEAQAEIADLDEHRWILNHCVKEPHKVHQESSGRRATRGIRQLVGKTNKPLVKRIVVPPEVAIDSHVKKRGRKPGSRVLIVADVSLLRWSFRQLSMSQETSVQCLDRQQRHCPKQAEKKTQKRRGRKPRWLVQEGKAQVASNAPRYTVRHGKKTHLFPNDRHPKEHGAMAICEQRDNMEEMSSQQYSCSVLEVSFPDNELIDSSSLEQEKEVQSLHQDDIVESDTPVKGCVSGQDASMSMTYAEPCENPMIKSNSLATPPVVKDTVLEEHFIKGNGEFVQHLHSYSKIHRAPVKGATRYSASVPKKVSWSKSTELGQQSSGDDRKLVLPQPPSGTGIISTDGVEVSKPGVDLEISKRVVQAEDVVNLPISSSGTPESTLHFPDGKDISGKTTILPTSSIHVRNCIASQTTSPPGPERKRVLASVLSHANGTESEKASAKLPAVSTVRMEKSFPVLHCCLCDKEFKGGNMMRHASAHLQRDKLKCMFCGKLFNCQMTAKNHVANHIEEMKAQASHKDESVHGNITYEALDQFTASLSPDDRHKRKLANDAYYGAPLNSRTLNHTLKDLKNQEGSVPLKDKAAVQEVNGSVLMGKPQSRKEDEFSAVDRCTFVSMGVALISQQEVDSQPRDAEVVEKFTAGYKDGEMIVSMTAADKVLANGYREDRVTDQTISTHRESRAANLPDGDGMFSEVRCTDDSTGGATDQQEAIVVHAEAKANEQLDYVGPSSRPFIRLSPSSYLDESFISMPKRRKPSPENHRPPTLQRCSSCFSSFSCMEELQRHLSLNKCATLFGFDSDDEGKSDWA